MNKNKLHEIVEYIRSCAEFPFDVVDVEEDLAAVLSYFGLFPAMTEFERNSLRVELGAIAAEAEWSEMEHQVAAQEEDPFPGMHPMSLMSVGARIRSFRPAIPFAEWVQGLCLQ